MYIGYSPESDEQAATAGARGADYLGVGPIFGTTSKSDAGDAIGTDTLSRRARIAGIPVIGIGGIGPGNARRAIEAGAVGVAVVSSILRSADPGRAASEIADAVTGSLLKR
jgi:thiamine-phosphate diphosphorylase